MPDVPGPDARHSSRIAAGFMTFLNPFVLFGLAAAAIPFILHLLNLRKLRTIEFSSIRFLHELQKTRIRRLKLRQWLLLLIRTLLIIFLVFAFARPALRGHVADFMGGRAATTMILIIDDSPSMAVRNESGELFAEARRTAGRLLGLARPGDQVYVVPLSALREGKQTPQVVSGDTWTAILNAMELGHVRVPYIDAVRVAERIAEASTNANKELYLLSDGQATQFLLPAQGSDSAGHPESRLKAFLLEIPHRLPDNAGVGAVTLMSQIIAQNKPLALRARVNNFGSSLMRNSVVSAYLGGSRVAQQTVDIPPMGSVSVDFTIVPKSSGILDGHVQIEEDALVEDNQRFYVVDVPDSLSVLLVGSQPQDIRLTSMALLPGGDSSFTGLFRVRRAMETQLSSVDFGSADVVVLCGVRDFSDVEADRLAQFVRAGGGLLIFPGPQSDIPNYSSTLFAKLGIPPASAATKEGPADSASGTAGTLSFDRVDFAHPLFEDLFEQRAGKPAARPSLESPVIRQCIGITAGARGRTIIGLPNGKGFLDEFSTGEGRVFLFAVDAGLAWSDFPVKGLFAPLLYRSMLYLSATGKAPVTSTTGEPLEFHPRLRGAHAGDAFVVRSPSGIDTRVIPERSRSSGITTITLADSHEPGIYRLFRADGLQGRGNKQQRVAALAANIDPAESDLRLADTSALRAFWERAGLGQDQVHELSSTDPLTERVLQSRFGIELWRYFLILAVLMGLAEMLVARPRKQDLERAP